MSCRPGKSCWRDGSCWLAPGRAVCLSLLLGALGCGDQPAPDPPSWEDSLPAACIRSSACSIQTYHTVHHCIDYYHDLLVDLGQAPVYDPIYRCVNRAEGCAALRRCYGPVEPCDISYQASCHKGKALFCDLIDHLVYRHDCTAAGLSCQLDATYAHSAGCLGAEPVESTLALEPDCAQGFCQLTVEGCTEDDANRCRGRELEGCIDGRWVRFDCSALGLGPCRLESGGWARCSEPGS